MLVQSRTRPIVLGHRGASAHALDNTLDAFRLAAEHGADGVELDVRFTSDWVVVLHHDATLPDFGPFIEHSFNELRAAAAHVPTLDEAAAVLEGLTINVEIKNYASEPDHDPDHRMAETIVEWIARRDRLDDVIVSSFNPATVDRVRALDPAVSTGQLVDPFARLSREIDSAGRRGLEWVVLSKHHMTRHGAEVTTSAHDRDLKVCVWTVDSTRRLRELAADGVDAVITNDPLHALNVYASG